MTERDEPQRDPAPLGADVLPDDAATMSGETVPEEERRIARLKVF